MPDTAANPAEPIPSSTPVSTPEPGGDGNEDPGSEADTVVTPPGRRQVEPTPVIRPTPG